jgi:hypothetical protein
MEHRDSPGIEPEPASEPPSNPGRRFARLVESPAARRVAMPRLIIAGVLVLVAIVLVGFGLSRLIRTATEWVDRRPEHLIRFSQIELDPAPGPWLKGGPSRILEVVGARTEVVNLLEINLKEVEEAFKTCAWVKKVRRVDRSHFGRLIVSLDYRAPVAVVPFKRAKKHAVVLDDEAVVLPDEDIDWTNPAEPYQVKGMAGPLIQIKGVPETLTDPQFGLPWKRKVEGNGLDDTDPMVLRAARIARFLQAKQTSDKPTGPMPIFSWIYLPDVPDGPFFLSDAEKNLVNWGKAPGDEKAGEPSSEARWEMLAKWVHGRGPRWASWSDFLFFTPDGARLQSELKKVEKR